MTKKKITALSVSSLVLALAGLWAVPCSLAKAHAVRFLSKPAAAPPNGQVSAIDAQHIWVGLTYTGDGGRSWVAHLPPATEAEEFEDIPSNLQTAFFATARRGWLVGTRAVWGTTDGGLTWSKLFEGHIHAVGFADQGAGWMGVGDNGGVRNFVTTDFGRTWSHCGEEWKLNAEAPLSSVSLLDGKRGWITVARYDEIERPILSGVARTEDGGCTWKTLWWNHDENQENFGSLQFVDTSFGWLLADGYGKLRQTSDGGLTWRTVKLPAANFNIQGGRVIDRVHGWVLGNFEGMDKVDSGIFYTSDAGEHWQAIPTSDLRTNRGMAHELPRAWGDGMLVRVLAAHGKP